jgi:hypothetical protein
MELGGQSKRRGQIHIHIMRWHTKGWSILHPCNLEGKIKEEDKRTILHPNNGME